MGRALPKYILDFGIAKLLIQTTTMTIAIMLLILITKQMAITNVHNILNTSEDTLGSRNGKLCRVGKEEGRTP